MDEIIKSLYRRIKEVVDHFVFKFFNKLIGKYAHNTFSRFWVLLVDLIMVFVAYGFVFLTNGVSDGYHQSFYVTLLLVVYLVLFLLFGSYKGMLRYSGFGDLRRLLAVSLGAFVLLFVCRSISQHLAGVDTNDFFPRNGEILNQVLMVLIIQSISRLVARRVYNEYYKRSNVTNKQKVLVFGAGSGGVLTYNIIMQDTESKYEIVAFVDDNFKKVNTTIQGVPVYLPSKVFRESYIHRNNIEAMIIAIPSMNEQAKAKLAEKAMDLGLKVKMIPHVYELVEGNMRSDQIRDIQIEDLLGRDPIVLENEDVAREIEGKVVLVTGAAGSIGSEIARQVMNYGPSKMIVLDDAESPLYDIRFELVNTWKGSDNMFFEVADVRNRQRMQAVFERYRPQLVFHAAAYKHVPLMEAFPYEAVLVNVFGTKNMADLSIQYGVEKMVMISTDKAVNPTNVMGATKRLAEIYVQSRQASTQFVTTRFGNVLGSNGSVIPLFRKQLEKGGPLTVTDKRIIRFFMTIPEACNLVLQAASLGKGGEIFVFDMGKPVRIYDLANRMIQLSGKHNVEIKEVGLRPGEKLYEELLANKENTLPTLHKKIFRAEVRPYVMEEVDAAYQVLYEALLSMDEFRIVAQMKRIVPEFVSNNSRFSSLDTRNASDGSESVNNQNETTPPVEPNIE